MPCMTPNIRNERRKFAIENREGDWNNVVFAADFFFHDGKQIIGIWGCVSQNGLGDLYFTNEQLAGNAYRNVLQNNLVPIVNKYHGGFNNITLCVDTLGLRTNKDWFDEIDKIIIPPLSADLSVFQNIWNMATNDWGYHYRCMGYMPENLRDYINNRWSEFAEQSKKDLKLLYVTMSSCLQSVTTEDGGPTVY